MTYKKPEEMNPFERIEYELKLIEWSCSCNDCGGGEFCPSCGRSKEAYGEHHALDCSFRTIRGQLEQLSGTVWFND